VIPTRPQAALDVVVNHDMTTMPRKSGIQRTWLLFDRFIGNGSAKLASLDRERLNMDIAQQSTTSDGRPSHTATTASRVGTTAS